MQRPVVACHSMFWLALLTIFVPCMPTELQPKGCIRLQSTLELGNLTTVMLVNKTYLPAVPQESDSA